MAQEKPGHHAPSFTRLIRGAAGPQDAKETPGSKPILSREPPKQEEKKRKPILLPFAKGENEAALFSIGYREWAFLFGSALLLFGGMALIRYFAPKEGPVTPAFEVAPTDFDEASRAPGGGEPTDEVVTSAVKARDTTRLVQPLAELAAKDDKKAAAKTPGEDVKNSFWEGLKQTEKQAAKAPKLPGMLGALDAALGGLRGGSGGGNPVVTRSPEDIAARAGGVKPNPSRGAPGMRLGYSGGQNVPGIGGGRGRRSRAESGDAGRKTAGREGIGNLYGQPERLAAQAANKFGESTNEGSANQGPGGASPGGGTPAQEKGGDSQVNYKIGRDPVADYMAQKQFDWEMEKKKKFFEKVWPGPLYDGLSTVAAKGIFEPVAGVVAGAIKGLVGPKAPPAQQYVHSLRLNDKRKIVGYDSTPTVDFLAPRFPNIPDDQLSSAIIDSFQHSLPDATDENCTASGIFTYQGKETTSGGEKDTATNKPVSRNFGGIPCSKIVGTGWTPGEKSKGGGSGKEGAADGEKKDKEAEEPAVSAEKIKNLSDGLRNTGYFPDVTAKLIKEKVGDNPEIFETLKGDFSDIENYENCKKSPPEHQAQCLSGAEGAKAEAVKEIEDILGIKAKK